MTVKFSVGTLEDKDAYIAFAYQDDKGDFQVDQTGVAKVTAASGYAYSVSLEPKKEYYALASIDDDGDGQPFGDADRLGVWRDITNFEPIDVELGLTVADIDFALVPQQTHDTPSAGIIGDACTSGSQCNSGQCDTSLPSGYCTQDCLTSEACPSGSTCSYTNTAHTAAQCFEDCTDPGSKSSCQTGSTCPAARSAGACQSP